MFADTATVTILDHNYAVGSYGQGHVTKIIAPHSVNIRPVDWLIGWHV